METITLTKEVVKDKPKPDLNIAKVALDLPVISNTKGIYYYKIPLELKDEVNIGSAVLVPFGKQELIGYIIEILQDEANLELKNIQLKHIYRVIYREPVIDKNYLLLAHWISNYYRTNIGTVLGASLPTELFEHHLYEVTLNINLLKDTPPLTYEQKFIVNKLLNSKNKTLSYNYLTHKMRFTKTKFYHAINKLKHKGIIETKTRIQKRKFIVSPKISFELPFDQSEDAKSIVLNEDQQKALDIILETAKNPNHYKNKEFLLHGVTGSGKTEVYLRVIEEIIKQNKTVIYLVPEIYLIPQSYHRLKSRFPETQIILWHSFLTKGERLQAWFSLHDKSKKGKIILGLRSAILAPSKNIGLIVIDEAHEVSYKQSSQAPRYNTLKVAHKRSEIENCVVILGTATPNINDYYLCEKNNLILELPKRINDVPMPEVKLINLKDEYNKSKRGVISEPLKKHIEEALNKKEQVILLLNRRGFASHVFCRVCGFTLFCNNCSIPMVYHKNTNTVICHHCGHSKSYNETGLLTCPECKSPHFRYFGIGTQQLEEEVKINFKSANIIRVDSDQLKKKNEYITLWKEFAEKKVDILIGTQLVSKGLDNPNVTVVGVIFADTMLNFPDYVSYEKAFQLLTQITGRAGRSHKPGKVFIQSYKIEEPIFQFVKEHDYKGFYKYELKHRKEFLYPPYTNLHRIIFQSQDEKACINYSQDFIKQAKNIIDMPNESIFLGPAPCFFNKLHGKYRYHILCKFTDENIKNELFNTLIYNFQKNAKVELIIDIDSVNLL